KFKERLLGAWFAGTTVPAGTWKVSLVGSGYTPSPSTHEYYTDLGANVLSTLTLASITEALGVLDAADPTFLAVTAGSTAKYLVIWLDTGTGATSPLAYY